MTEDFLHHLWKYRLIGYNPTLTSGEPIDIIHPGEHNKDSGPDFFNARLKIGETLWAGNVEVHTESSLWYRHKHHLDQSYASVILHLVYEHDKEVVNPSGEKLPTLELKGQINEGLLKTYNRMMLNRNVPACAPLIRSVGRLTLHNWIDRLIVERLDRQSELIEAELKVNTQDWNEAFYQSLGRSFGFKVNALPFEFLTRSLPYSVIRKHTHDRLQLEALLYGQAGLLSERLRSAYYVSLKNEYRFLRQKYCLKPIEQYAWKFLRMRPSNFPTIRISQFADLLSRSRALFSILLEEKSLQVLRQLFRAEASAFWDNHYTFRRASRKGSKRLGMASIHLLSINTLIPFLYLYGKKKNRPDLVERALFFLEQIPGERNAVIRRWDELNLPVVSAYQTQALLELRNRYCVRKRCLDCGVGVAVFLNCSTEKG